MFDRRSLLRLGAAGAATAALGVVSPGASLARASVGPPRPGQARLATGWFDALYDIVKNERLSPVHASRAYAVAAVAIHEAIAATSSRRSLAKRLNGTLILPTPGRAYLHDGMVANSAVAQLLSQLGMLSPAGIDAVREVERNLAADLAGTGPFEHRGLSIDFGVAVGSSVAAWAREDGFEVNQQCPYIPSPVPEAWVPTPPGFQSEPLEPCWGAQRPIALGDVGAFVPAGPPPYSADPGSPFRRAAELVADTGRGLDTEQKTIATYWSDAPGATGTPPGHWIAITGQFVRRDGLTLAEAAFAYAAVGIALHDAFICCWRTKYEFNILRPVTYIQRVLDPVWRPYLVTPSFPSYTSGHATQSGSAATVLTALFGKRRFVDTTHLDHDQGSLGSPRVFSSFLSAASEASVSRLYGGIHFGFDNEDGYNAGRRLGRAVLDRLR